MSYHAVLLATTATPEGAPAAALQADGVPLIRRLADQLATLEVTRVHVVTRPDLEQQVVDAVRGATPRVEVVTSPDAPSDLRLVGDLACGSRRAVVVADAGVLTHREALAGLLADPRIVSGILSTTVESKGPWS